MSSSSLGSSSRILVIGGTGTMGQHLVKASLAAGHPTAALVRPATAANPSKLKLLEAIKGSGATILYQFNIRADPSIYFDLGHATGRPLQGDIYEHESLVAAMKQVDVVISAVGHRGPRDLGDGQLRIVQAIKEAPNVKRFVPSEFGCDVDQAVRRRRGAAAAVVEPARSMLLDKVAVWEAVRAAGVPHNFICTYCPHGFLLPRLGDPQLDGPPTTKATIFGHDNTRVIFVHEADMSALTIKAVEDPRTLNKILYVRPASNTCSFSHLVHLWEQMAGRTLHSEAREHPTLS
ncbi:hypothetical protein U9M48_021337 [Paspalum notatum var. saurae]|uniref:NmrA-like domain-containing protein n=1 Tax=Paspalum notatum var. saurae TaxID=547442 RepID=A0AAQ3WST7_PASNO